MKILMMGDSPTISTGFGRVNKLIAQTFIDAGHEVKFVGWCYMGEPHGLPYPIYGTDPQQDYWCKGLLPLVINQFRPDVLFTLGDPWMVDWIPDLISRRTFKWISYFPIDGFPVPNKWLSLIENMDVPVVFSRFAKQQIESRMDKEIELIYHGVDTETFYPLDKKQIREEAGLTDNFIVGCVARNQPRKNIPALFKAFCSLAERQENALLYLHMSKFDIGWNLDDLIDRFSLKGRVLITEGLTPANGVTDSELNHIYNLFDVMVLPTMGEGFGLPILEAQACGCPVIATNFSSCPELIPYERGKARIKGFITNNNGLDHAIVDELDIYAKLTTFYHMPSVKEDCGERGLEFAKTMKWENVLPKFIELLKRGD